MRTTIELRGLKDVDRLLSQVAPRQAQNIMRATVHGMAGEIRNDAKKAMPEDDGDMKRATKAKRRRARGSIIRSDVLVGREAFYWRFLEYGQGPDGIEYAFFMKAVEKLRQKMTERFLRQFGKKFEAALARARKKA
jgi:hypothetical protein